MSDTLQQETSTEVAQRLPCRGCLEDCVHRAVCEGKPWRMASDRRVVEQA